MPLQEEEFRTVTVPLRLEWFDGLIKTIPVVVIDHDDATEEIRLDGQVIGFIHHAGRIFVALTGSRLDRAEECAQCLLWDKAAAMLVTRFGRLPEPSPRMTAPTHVPGDRDDARVSSVRQHAVHEMSR